MLGQKWKGNLESDIGPSMGKRYQVGVSNIIIICKWMNMYVRIDMCSNMQVLNIVVFDLGAYGQQPKHDQAECTNSKTSRGT